MINYKFPLITHLDDVKKVLDKEEFILVDKGDYQVITYVYQDSTTFTDPLHAECRGIIFDKDGHIMSRRFHKFFNLGEKDLEVDWNQPHVILEKLDGSMISPIEIDGCIRWTTKMGITDVAMQAEEFVAKNPVYSQFAETLISMGKTPIFEWCSRKQRIVVDYPEDKLVLLAVRNNVNGRYYTHSQVKEFFLFDCFENIPLVETVEMEGLKEDELVKAIRANETFEGIIIQFDNGHMIKVKGDWYLQLHRAKAATDSEEKLLTIILDDKLDDLLPTLPDDLKDKVIEYQDNVMNGIIKTCVKINTYYQEAGGFVKDITRKKFASNVMTFDPVYRPILFKMFDKTSDSLFILTTNAIRRKIKKLDEVRDLMDGVEYDITI